MNPTSEASVSGDVQPRDPDGIRPTAASDRGRLGRFRRAAAGSLVAVALLSAIAFAAGVTVTPWQEPDIQEFNPASPPPGLGKDGADCIGRVEWTGGDPLGHYSDVDSTYVIKSIGDVEVTGHSLIRLPSDADTVLENHEHAHDRLNAYEYAKHARKKFEAAIRKLVGRVFKGVGATAIDRTVDAKNKARVARDSAFASADSSIIRQMRSLSSMFDDLTKHGLSETCSTNEGETRTKDKHEAAPPAGTPKKEKDESKQKATGGTTNRIAYSDPAQSLVYVGAGEIAMTTNPADPVRALGRVLIDDFIVIGPQEDGSILLSDSRLRIENMATGDTLLNGYLLEAAHVSSGEPGAEGTVQAYLAILPAWAGGVSNTIGSDFLAEMQVAGETNGLTMVWLEAPVAMFDTSGASLLPPEGVPAPFTIGFAVPPVIAVGGGPASRPVRLAVSPQPGTGAVRFAWAPLRGTVRLELYDIAGARRRSVTVDAARGAWSWDGTDDHGRALPAGVYFAQFEGPGVRLRSRVVRLQ